LLSFFPAVAGAHIRSAGPGTRYRNMGEFTDKLKGGVNKTVGGVKQSSSDPEVRQDGDAQRLKGSGQEVKGKIKGVINKL
jgi:uncharacterized protein YjbJ (UPF0337 family)